MNCRARPCVVLPVLAASLMALPALARANGGPVEDWGGNNIVPVNTADVQLVCERV